jgi:hypothetical protein
MMALPFDRLEVDFMVKPVFTLKWHFILIIRFCHIDIAVVAALQPLKSSFYLSEEAVGQ